MLLRSVQNLKAERYFQDLLIRGLLDRRKGDTNEGTKQGETLYRIMRPV